MMGEHASTMQEIETELRKALSYLTGDNNLMSVDANIPFKDLGLDSMMAIEIMAAMEKKFKIELQEKDVVKFKNIKDTVTILAGYLK
jgi:acyl carrier protein